MGNVKLRCEQRITWKDLIAFSDRVRRGGGGWVETEFGRCTHSRSAVNGEAENRKKDPCRVATSGNSGERKEAVEEQ